MSSKSLRFLSKAYNTCSSASSRMKTLFSRNHSFDVTRCERVPPPDPITFDDYDSDASIFDDQLGIQSISSVSDHDDRSIHEQEPLTPWYDPYAVNFEASIASAEERLSLAETRVLPIAGDSEQHTTEAGENNFLKSGGFAERQLSVLNRMNAADEYMQAKIDHQLAQSRLTRLRNDVLDLTDGIVPTIGENDIYLAEQDGVYSSYLDKLRDVISHSELVDERFGPNGEAYPSSSAMEKGVSTSLEGVNPNRGTTSSLGESEAGESDSQSGSSVSSLPDQPTILTNFDIMDPATHHRAIPSPLSVLSSTTSHVGPSRLSRPPSSHFSAAVGPVESVDPTIPFSANIQNTSPSDYRNNGERVPQHRCSMSTVFGEDGSSIQSGISSYGQHTDNGTTATDQGLTQSRRSRWTQSIQRSKEGVRKFIGKHFNTEAVWP